MKHKRQFTYELFYRNDTTNKPETYQFKASCDYEAKLIALEYCDQNWFKYYGVIRLKGNKK